MRTTVDLIKELKESAFLQTGAALIVGFENKSEMIFSNDEGGLTKLNNFINDGGEPIGIVRYTQITGKLSVTVHPLEEYAEEKWALKFLKAFTEQFSQLIQAHISQQKNNA